MRRQALCATLLLLVLSIGLTAGPAEQAAANDSTHFTVQFRDCVETIGVGLVLTELALTLVPPEFHLVGEGQPVTPIVVRTADCGGIAVDGHRRKAGSVVQIGVVIVPPDFTGDINNYTLWYYTSDSRLAHQLSRLGVSAQHVPSIDYDYEPSGDSSPGALYVAVPRPGRPRLSLDGIVIESQILAGSFHANWWAKVNGRSVKMETLVPEIFIGGANLELTTDPSSLLGELIGGGTAGFPVLEQFNTFRNAAMKVTVVAP